MSFPCLAARRLAIVPILCAPLCAPWPLLAATYKCTVDGKTVYQQAPCGPGVEGEAMRIQSAPTGGGSYSADESAKMRQQVTQQGPRLAREAFDRLKSGRVDEYVANLCPRERQAFSNPTIKGSLKVEGANLASRKIAFGRQTDASFQSLSFLGIEDPFGPSDGKTPPKTLRINAEFGRDLGQLCLRAMSFWSGR